MGQRLVIKCVRGGKMIATLYYHWSAYTINTFEEGAKLISSLIREYDSDMSNNQVKLLLLDILQRDVHADLNGGYHCGGPDNDDYRPFIEIGYENKDGKMFSVDRDRGLIAITESHMAEHLRWGEEFATLDFDNKTFTNDVFNEYDPEDPDDKETLSDFGVEDPYEYAEFEFPNYFDGFTVKWNDIFKAYRWFHDIYNSNSWILGMHNGKILCQVS